MKAPGWEGSRMTHKQLDLKSLMHARGFRITPQRQLILDAVCESGAHSTPEEIYARVHNKAPAVNRATVYRGLEFLHSQHLVYAADLGGGKRVYEIAGETPHHHLVCERCGAVSELTHRTVKGLFHKIEREQGFEVETDHLALFGQCADCRAAEAASQPRVDQSKA